MEETLGKRISAARKKLRLTQDQLAERLGVTAQAVSKWENDQSCPDIQTLPRLAEIFGITTDALLGADKGHTHHNKVFEAEILEGPEESTEDRHVEISLGGARRTTLGFAIWLLLCGAQLLLLRFRSVGLWEVLWTTGLLVFGLMGLYPRFSVFRLGCGALGGYYIACNLIPSPPSLGWAPLLLILGALLLLDSLLPGKKKHVCVSANGKNVSRGTCEMEGERFDCQSSFGEKHYRVDLPRLSGGKASQSFGQLELDLTGCGEIADGCTVEVSNSFGEMTLIVPRSCRVQSNVSASFGSFENGGQPDPEAQKILYLRGSVSFGETKVLYR